MADPSDEPQQSSPTPAQVPPPFRSLGEIDIAQMIFELQGSFGEVKEGLRTTRLELIEQSKRLDTLSKIDADLKNTVSQLAPKIEDIAGFLKHRAPHLVDKQDLVVLKSALESDSEKRPTRRQSVIDVALLVGLIGGLLTIGSRLAR